MSLGFENAPITRFLSLSVFLVSAIFSESPDIPLDLNSIVKGEVWRILSSSFVFGNMAQTFCGLILLYNCRQFERQLGIRKFGTFIVLSFLLSVSCQLLTALAFQLSGSLSLYTSSPGPYFLIYSLLSLFHAHVPKLQSSQYTCVGLGLSEKSWVYLLAAQLALGAGLNSFLPALIGVAIGFMYDRNRFGIQNCRLPSAVDNVLGIVGGYVNSFFHRQTQGPGPRNPMGGIALGNMRAGAGTGAGAGQYQRLQSFGDDADGEGDDFQQTGGQGLFGYNPTSMYGSIPTQQPPSEENISTLVGLGFEREAVVRALENANNNVDAAANLLLR